jgi:DHA1 family bicyclomycin/chloramphenicol resistance-like MFS transporter
MMPVGFLSAGLALSIGPASAVALSSFADSAGTASAVLGFIQMVGAAMVISAVQQTNIIAPQAVSLIVFVIVIPLLCVMYLPKLSAWSTEK